MAGYTATAWDFAFAVVRPNGLIAPGPQYPTLALAQREADRLNRLLAPKGD